MAWRSPDGYCDTGLADLIVNQIAAEQQNIVTNPLLNAWQDSGHNEATDECRNFFATGGDSGQRRRASPETVRREPSPTRRLARGNYYLNDAFNLASLKLPYPAVPCLGGINLVAEIHLAQPCQLRRNRRLRRDGVEHHPERGHRLRRHGPPKATYATYNWNFGDGTPEVTGYAPGAPRAPNCPRG